MALDLDMGETFVPIFMGHQTSTDGETKDLTTGQNEWCTYKVLYVISILHRFISL